MVHTMPNPNASTSCQAGKDVVAQLLEEIESLRLTIIGEQEARWKLEAAYRQKDAAVSRLMEICQSHGIDLSHLIP